MRTKTQKLLAAMNVLSWITFIGLMIKAGAILISYCISMFNPEGSKNLYSGLDLYGLRQYSFFHYNLNVCLMIALFVLQGYIAFLVIRALSRIKLSNPFTAELSKVLEQISYFMLATWVLAMIFNLQSAWLMKQVSGLRENLISGEFIFLAGVVFVIAQIFKRGVEIQTENELTV
ncbi:MAG: DUF2975 domain-containing protein [Flavisolibacter sp.]